MLRKLVLALISLYQKHVSGLKQPTCRFQPTCSEYARQAVVKYGALKGTWLGLRRIVKCHPWHPGGIDNVP